MARLDAPWPRSDAVRAPQPHLLFHTTDKLCLNAAGGKAGFPLTVSTMQLGVGVLYALFAWAAPEMRDVPSVTMEDIMSMIPVSFCAAAAHSFSVFAQSAGAVSFAMIVKAAEPAFAAIVGTLLYGKSISSTKWAMLVPVIGGVILASVKELDFAWSAPPPPPPPPPLPHPRPLTTPSPQASPPSPSPNPNPSPSPSPSLNPNPRPQSQAQTSPQPKP